MVLSSEALEKRKNIHAKLRDAVGRELGADAVGRFDQFVPFQFMSSLSKRCWEAYITMWRQLVANPKNVVFIKPSTPMKFVFK